MWQTASMTALIALGKLSAEYMDVTVRVISGGQEIERVIRPVRMENGTPAVTYRKRLWRVVDGCIHVDSDLGVGVGVGVGEEGEPEWASLVEALLPQSLPDQVDACSKLLQGCFRESLSHGVIQATASLVALRFERQARTLLVDVLKDHRDAARLYRLLQMQLLFRERSEKARGDLICSVPLPEQDDEPEVLEEADLAWEWAPSEEGLEAPDVDDNVLRTAAADIQESLGAHRAIEVGASIPGFEDLDHEPWLDGAPEVAPSLGNNESVLLERIARLGTIALDLLRYFADNPGDRAVHAEAVLGYPISEINRLLLGSLRHYLNKDRYGGWECQSWVVDILPVLDQSSDGR